jgi:hypothetical protein
MKTKLFLFFAVLMMSFGVNAQVTSVAVVGEAAGGWPGSPGNPGPEDIHQMTSTDGENWTLNGLVLTTFATDGGIKFRANNSWDINWGAAEFPAGTGTQGGANIQCIAGTYDVTFNSTTGVYNFSGGTPLPTVKLVGVATGTVDGIAMNFVGSDTYRASNVTLLDGAGQFSIDDVLVGEPTFPTGTLTGASDNIPVVAGFYSSVSLNLITGEYSFVLIPPVSIVGDGVGGWPPFAGADPNQLSSSDAINYSLDKLACIVGPAKFRQDNDWAINWGNPAFPSGTATQGGENIDITAAGTYDVRFNRVSGDYSFSIPTIALVGSATPTGWPTGAAGEIDAAALTTNDGVTYFLSSVDLIAGECKFRTNNAWDVNFGAPEFPLGVGTQGGANIVVPAASTYSVSLNRVTGEYVFTDLLSATSFNKNTFKVYPNPTNRSWNFVSTSDKNITAIQIVDMLGKTVMTINPAATSANVDATNITSGLYFAKVTTTSGTETVKLMKN